MDQGRSLPTRRASTAGQELGPQEKAGGYVEAMPDGRLERGTSLHRRGLLTDDCGGEPHHHGAVTRM
jgi:hypothetical protein